MVEFSQSAILDTNIIIYTLLGKLQENLFQYNSGLCLADKVQDELENKFNGSKEYSDFCAFSKDKRIFTIYENHFDNKTIKAMEVTLAQYGMKSCFGRKAHKKNEGEMVSALYAYYKGIPIFYTHDLKFIIEFRDKPIFKTIRMVNFNQLLKKIVPNEKIHIIRNFLQLENMKMEEALVQEKNKLKVQEFMERFNIVLN